MSGANTAVCGYFSENFVPDAFKCNKCGSIFIDYDEDDIVYDRNVVSSAYYNCQCLDCKHKFKVLLKDIM